MKQVVRAFLQAPDEKFLLVKHHWSDTWTLPWGHIDEWETLYEALIREVQEEFQLSATVQWKTLGIERESITEQALPVAIYQIEFESHKWGWQKKMEYIFHVRVDDISPLQIQEEEIAVYNWFTKQEILELTDIFSQVPDIIRSL